MSVFVRLGGGAWVVPSSPTVAGTWVGMFAFVHTAGNLVNALDFELVVFAYVGYAKGCGRPRPRGSPSGLQPALAAVTVPGMACGGRGRLRSGSHEGAGRSVFSRLAAAAAGRVARRLVGVQAQDPWQRAPLSVFLQGDGRGATAKSTYGRAAGREPRGRHPRDGSAGT